jgi:hypothetical protein
MWDETDIFGRWLQAICAVFLAFLAIGGAYMFWNSTFLMFKFGGGAVFVGCVRVCWRCARYAVTGQGNINRDNF